MSCLTMETRKRKARTEHANLELLLCALLLRACDGGVHTARCLPSREHMNWCRFNRRNFTRAIDCQDEYTSECTP
jgi:hypothetical protein